MQHSCVKFKQNDMEIMRELENDGRTSISDLAEITGLARQTVTRRLEKMEESDQFRVLGGVNMKQNELRMVIASFEVIGNNELVSFLEFLNICPRVYTVFTPSSDSNVKTMLWGCDVETINSTIECFRDQENINLLGTEYLGVPTGGYVFAPLRIERNEYAPCGKKCERCSRYQSSQCKGCPSTKAYKNPLLK